MTSTLIASELADSRFNPLIGGKETFSRLSSSVGEQLGLSADDWGSPGAAWGRLHRAPRNAINGSTQRRMVFMAHTEFTGNRAAAGLPAGGGRPKAVARQRVRDGRRVPEASFQALAGRRPDGLERGSPGRQARTGQPPGGAEAPAVPRHPRPTGAHPLETALEMSGPCRSFAIPLPRPRRTSPAWLRPFWDSPRGSAGCYAEESVKYHGLTRDISRQAPLYFIGIFHG